MKSNSSNFRAIIIDGVGSSKSKTLSTPVFQRPYCWRVEQFDELWSSLERLIKARTEDAYSSHLMGMVILQEPSVSGKGYQLIDGQQRLTTILLLLVAIRDRLKLIDGSDYITSEINRYLYARVNKGVLGEDPTRELRLQHSALDRPEFYRAVSGDVGYKREIKSKPIASCHRYWVSKLEGSDFEYLKTLYEVVIEDLKFVPLTLSADETASFIFSTVNGSGVHLTVSELVKNTFLEDFSEEEAMDLHNEHWIPFESLLKESIDQKKFFESLCSLFQGSPNAKSLYREMRSLKQKLGGDFYKAFTEMYRIYALDERIFNSLPWSLKFRCRLLQSGNKFNQMTMCSVVYAYREGRLTEREAEWCLDLSIYLIVKGRVLTADGRLPTDTAEVISCWNHLSHTDYLGAYYKHASGWRRERSGAEFVGSVFSLGDIENLGIKVQAELCKYLYSLYVENEISILGATLDRDCLKQRGKNSKEATLADFELYWVDSKGEVLKSVILSDKVLAEAVEFGLMYFQDVLKTISASIHSPEREVKHSLGGQPSIANQGPVVEMGSRVRFLVFGKGGTVAEHLYEISSAPVAKGSDSIYAKTLAGRDFLGRSPGETFKTVLRDGGEVVEIRILEIRG